MKVWFEFEMPDDRKAFEYLQRAAELQGRLHNLQEDARRYLKDGEVPLSARGGRIVTLTRDLLFELVHGGG